MAEFVRYAIYWLPKGPLGRWGEGWLGWQMATGMPLPRPVVPGLPMPLPDLTAAATAYGLHATLKPPFALAPGQDQGALRRAFAAFCTTERTVVVPGLRLTNLDGFMALTPAGDNAAVKALARNAVAALDPFRAPPGAAELARRRSAGLTDRQEALLQRWGYPYVMDEFRFHVTLTGRVNTDQAAQVRAVLGPLVAPHLEPQLQINGLGLVGQMAQGGFKLIEHHEFPG